MAKLAYVMALAFLAFTFLLPLILIISICRRQIRWLIGSLVVMVAWCIIGPELIVVTFWGGFGPGAILSLLTLPAVLVSVAVFSLGGGIFILTSSKFDARFEALVTYWVGALIILALALCPLLLALDISQKRDELHREIGNTIVDSLEAYKQDHGDYPETVAALVPNYLSEVPSPTGFAIYDKYNRFAAREFSLPQFELEECGDTILVTVPVLTYGWIQRYNLATGGWSTVSVMDGICYGLEWAASD
jgi:fumarate reductase subunit D